jgi:hypothetical protein
MSAPHQKRKVAEIVDLTSDEEEQPVDTKKARKEEEEKKQQQTAPEESDSEEDEERSLVYGLFWATHDHEDEEEDCLTDYHEPNETRWQNVELAVDCGPWRKGTNVCEVTLKTDYTQQIYMMKEEGGDVLQADIKFNRPLKWTLLDESDEYGSEEEAEEE